MMCTSNDPKSLKQVNNDGCSSQKKNPRLGKRRRI